MMKVSKVGEQEKKKRQMQERKLKKRPKTVKGPLFLKETSPGVPALSSLA